MKLGIYRHWRGHLYQVIGVANDANSDTLYGNDEEQRWPNGDRRVVVYIGLDLTDASAGPRMHVREVEDFKRWVHRDGTECVHWAVGEHAYCHCDCPRDPAKHWHGGCVGRMDIVRRFVFVSDEFYPGVTA